MPAVVSLDDVNRDLPERFARDWIAHVRKRDPLSQLLQHAVDHGLIDGISIREAVVNDRVAHAALLRGRHLLAPSLKVAQRGFSPFGSA